jgi:hypothetical protein
LKIYFFCSFHLAKQFRQQPVAFAALLSAAFAAVLAVTAMLYWSGRRDNVESTLQVTLRRPPAPMAVAPAPSGNDAVSFPKFSSANFTDHLQSIAKDMGLAPEETSYSLESGPTQPYWRYRISFAIKSGYPQIRKFLAALSSEVPNLVLDSIRCHRENTATSGLTCELALSAFFQRASRE